MIGTLALAVEAGDYIAKKSIGTCNCTECDCNEPIASEPAKFSGSVFWETVKTGGDPDEKEAKEAYRRYTNLTLDLDENKFYCDSCGHETSAT